MTNSYTLIEKLQIRGELAKQEWEQLLIILFHPDSDLLFLEQTARRIQSIHYGKRVYLRALLEISNYCPNQCKYCGISSWNTNIERYRMESDTILSTVEYAYGLGYRSFVLQGGEDPYFTDEVVVRLIKALKLIHPDIALALSLGERSEDSYRAIYEAGVDRYLLRHETANEQLYAQLHPNMSFQKRVDALYSLKKIGFQTGSGFLVGLPGATAESYATDFIFLQDLQAEMIGIGPFIPHHRTPMAKETAGSIREVKILIALIRIAFPNALIPATTALGTLDPRSRYEAISMGANVLMPNITPYEDRKRYTLYDGKRISEDESATEVDTIRDLCQLYGMEVSLSRGDHNQFTTHENRN